MNRAQRRALARAVRTSREIAAAMASAPGCADCTAHVEPHEISPGVLRLAVMHDDTCPTYLAMTRKDH